MSARARGVAETRVAGTTGTSVVMTDLAAMPLAAARTRSRRTRSVTPATSEAADARTALGIAPRIPARRPPHTEDGASL
eukprot:9877024-Alexandrium_andersonii.AAC.1